jgi:hypothetical protein
VDNHEEMEPGMSASYTSYVCEILLATHSPTDGLTAVQRHWRRLAGYLSDQYRPELHYMRGPGPKWREKHAISAPAVDPAVALTQRRIRERFAMNERSEAQRSPSSHPVAICR